MKKYTISDLIKLFSAHSEIFRLRNDSCKYEFNLADALCTICSEIEKIKDSLDEKNHF